MRLRASVLFAVLVIYSASPAPSASEQSCSHYLQRTVDPVRGNDSGACLQASEPPCATLGYALSHVSDCVRVLVNASSVNLTAPVRITDVHGVVLTGNLGQRVVVSCAAGAGIYLQQVNNTELNGLAFQGCSVLHPSAILVPTSDEFYPEVASSLFFDRCVNITVNDCSFTSNRGSGVSIFNSGGQIVIRNSLFVNNTVTVNCTEDDIPACYNVSIGLVIKMTYCQLDTNCTSPQPVSVYNSHSNYIIDSCIFYGNNNSFALDASQTEAVLSFSVHRTLSHGGGVEIRLEGQATGNTFTFNNCYFTRNVALWGGGLEVGIGEYSAFNSVRVNNSKFYQNVGMVGGGVRMGVFPPTDYDGYGHEEKMNVFTIFNTTFEQNFAISAGALSYLSNAQLSNANLSHLLVIQCVFVNNKANDSGAAVAVSAWNNEIGGFPTYVEFEDCVFETNTIHFQVDITEIFGLGVVNSEKIPLIFTGNTTFRGNYGSAVVASSTMVSMNGSVDFEHNWGINGGGVVLMSLAWIQLNPGVRVNFFKNWAFMRGGAIYSEFVTSQVRNSSRYCIIKYRNNSVPISEWDAIVSFDSNTAQLDGPSIFLSAPVGCYSDNTTGLPFTDPNVFHYYDTNSTVNQIGGSPRKIDFGAPATNRNGTFHTSVMLGHSFSLHTISDDFFNHPTSGSALASLVCNPLYKDQCNSSTLTSEFSLEGEKLIQLDNTERKTSFSIHGPINSTQNETILLLLSNTLPSALGYLHIDITPCKLGYTYNSTTGSCDCIENSNLACGFSDDDEACVKYGYWVGRTGNSTNNSIVQHCSSNFCKYNNGYCPVSDCIRTLQSFCRLPAYDSDLLCEANRGGLLCSTCKKDHAFTFAAVQCVSDTTCSAAHTVLLVLLNLLFWTVLIVALLIALKLGFQIGSGHMYCLIYYFSILQYLTRNNYPESLNAVVALFQGFLEVNPRFFGLIPVCIFDASVSPIYHTVIEFIHPFFLFLVILLLILVTSRFPRLSRKVEFDGTKALCILLYFSFTSLVETSLDLLNFIELEDNSDSIRVALEPTVHYFDPSLHLPWALLSIAVLLLIAFPFILLLLLTPSIARILHINFVRFKPILDQYQSCYQEEYRWFASYYLICRVFVFAFSLVNLGEFGSIFFLQMISIVILVVHTAIQPYKNKWLNIIDSVLLADLALYSLFNGSTANIVLGGYSTYVREILIHVLILTPILYFICLCCYSLYSILGLSRVFEKIARKLRRPSPIPISGEGTYVNNTSVANTVNTRRGLEREPLLFSTSINASRSPHKAAASRKRDSGRPAREKSPQVKCNELQGTAGDVFSKTSVSPPK